MQHIGEIAAIATAISWTATALFFQVASRRIGSLVVNLLRLLIAALLYTVYMRIQHGCWIPHASAHAWTYLGISSLVGFVLGDFFLFKSYEYISSRTSMLIMSLSPPISALMGWIMLDERLPALSFLGMCLVLSGVCIVILYKPDSESGIYVNKHRKRGVLLAILGAIGQGVGGVFSKIGMGDIDPFMASHMRVLVAIPGFILIISGMQRWHKVKEAFSDTKGLLMTSCGAFFGPFLGVGLAMVSLQLIPVGVASTLMTTMPIFILAPSALFLKEKLTIREIIGAVVALAGIVVFFLH